MVPKANLRFQLFGEVSCSSGSIEGYTFSNRKVALIAALLAFEPGRKWQRNVIATIVWPDNYVEASLASLRQALALLRKDLKSIGHDPDEVLFASRVDVCLNNAVVESDVSTFRQSVIAADRLVDPAEAVLVRSRALELVVGPLMQGWASEWVDVERQRLALEVDDALKSQVQDLVRSGQTFDAGQLALRFWGLDPMNEHRCQLAVKTLTQAGDSPQAVKVYRKFERGLRESLGMSPTQATILLAREARKSAQPRPQLPAPNFPPNLTTFFGRENELLMCLKRGEEKGTRLVTIVGPGGTGKTRLAIEAANQAGHDFGSNRWFVECVQIQAADDVIGHVLSILQAPDDVAWEAESVGQHLGDRPALLVLDNLEQIGPGVGSVIDRLLFSCPGLKVIATSRQATGSANESILELGPLPVPGGNDTVELFASVQLFLDRMQSGPLAEHDRGAVAQIVSRLEGSPLAICLAAAQTTTMTPGQIVTELDDMFRLLSVEDDRFVERHQKLWTCIEWSYKMYPEAHAFLRSLAMFRGGWTLETSQLAYAHPVNSLTQTLLRSSLIHETGRSTEVRFDMFEAIREFVLCQMSRDELSDAETNHARAMRSWLMSDKVKNQPFDSGYIPTRGTEVENLRRAFEWSLANKTEWALDIVNGLSYYWWSRDMFREGSLWIQRAIEAHPREPRIEYAMAHRGLATMYTGISEYRTAHETLLAGLEFMPKSSDPIQRARYLNTMGNACANFDPELAVKYFDEGLTLVGSPGGETMVSTLRGNKAFALLLSGQLDEAEAYLEEAINETRTAGNSDWLAQFVHNYGLVAKTRGNWAKAERLFTESRAIVEGTTVDPAGRGWLTDAGLVVLRLGRTAEALQFLKESAAGIRAKKGSEAFVDLLEATAEWCHLSGDPEEAVALLVASSKLSAPGQRSVADTSLPGFGRLALLKSQLPPDTFRNASARYNGLSITEILEEIQDFELRKIEPAQSTLL